MRKQRVTSLMKLDLEIYKMPLIISSGIVLLMQGIRMLSVLEHTRADLYGVDSMGNYTIQSTIQATSIEHLLVSAGFPYIVFLWSILSTLVPVTLICREFMGAKSVYTRIRLPMPRMYYYSLKLIPGYVCAFIQWLLQLGMLLLFCVGYYMTIPLANRPNNPWEVVWKGSWIQWIFPFTNATGWLALISIILLPSTIVVAGYYYLNKKYII